MANRRKTRTRSISPVFTAVFLAGLLTPGIFAFAQESPAEQTPLSNTKALVYTAGLPRPVEQPLHLGTGPHLFMDDYLIASSENLARRVMVPQRDAAIPNPVVTGKEDGCFQPYMTILRDPETKRFRMWYGHRTEAFDTGQSHVALIESEDGIHWQRPARVLKDPAPIQFGVSVLDEGPEFQPASHRFRLAWYMDGGMKLAVSPEGVAWTPLGPDVLLHHNHDIDSLAFDPIRGRYHATISVYRPGEAWAGDRRITMQSCSTDLQHWTPPHYIITPEDGPDPGQTQFYAMDGYLARGGLFIGMVKVLRDDLKADDPPNPPDAYGVGYTALAWTRDGETWYRDREHFFDPDPAPSAWDHAHAWIDDQVLVNDEVYLYYGGYAHGHKVNRFEERQIGLVKIKRDRYVARVSGSETGRLKTPLFVLEGGSLAVNVNAQGGWLKVQILDAARNPLPGFALENCQPVSEDAVSAPVRWTRPLTELASQPVHIEFVLQDAQLFAFELLPPER
jgi:hypothetical protein